jgi:glycosyltransferase involved in cell wall biosynthesis
LGLRVCALDIAAGISDIDLSDKEDGVFCLISSHGRPVGDILLKSPSPRVSAELLREKIAEELGYSVFVRSLESYLSGEEDRVPHRMRDPRGRMPTVSVVVCTRDRPDDLRRCLESLTALAYPQTEVLVVDNASRGDETRLAAEEHSVRCVREDKPGLDFARNRGIAESHGSFVAFADDDVIVDPGWVDQLLLGFEDESIMCVTGLTMPAELASEAQMAFERYGDGGFRKGYERRVFDRLNLSPAAAGKVGAGANMAFRREAFDVVGGFDEALDCGTPAKAAGDLDMFYRILAAGYSIRYQPGALVYAFLTKCLVEYRDAQAVSVGVGWLRHQLREAARGLLGRGRLPLSLSLAEALGSIRGPAGYLAGKAYASRTRRLHGLERRIPAGGSGSLRSLSRFRRRTGDWQCL